MGVQAVRRNGTEEFVVMATDGLWDVVSSEDAVAFVWDHWRMADHGELAAGGRGGGG